MPLDTRIALGAQPLQLESPLAQYGQAVGIQNAMQQNQLGQMQMSAAQRAAEEEMGIRNYLTDPKTDLGTAEGQQGLMRFGAKGQMMLKNVAEQKKLSLEGQKLSTEIFGLTQKHFLEANSPIAAAANGEKGVENFIRATYAHPVLGALAKEIKPLDQAIAENIAMFKKDPDQWTTAHLNLDPKSALDAVTAARERANEATRIASLPPLPTAVDATGGVNAASAGLVVPGTPAAAATPALKQIGDFRVDPAISAANVLKLQQMTGQGPIKLAPNEYYSEDASGKLMIKTAPVSAAVVGGVNNLAPAAAPSVNALTGNEATLQAVNAERKTLIDRLDVLERMPPSKGREDEIKRREARLKEISAPINMRADGTTIIPGAGTLTAAAAPSDILRLQREEADLRAAGKTKEADVIANRVKKLNELTDTRTPSQKEQAVLDDSNATEAQKTNARLQLAKLNHVPEKSMSDFERVLAASNLPEAEKSKLRNQWLVTHATHAPPTQISLTQNAEKSYGTAFGGKIADLDVSKYDAASKAPELAANANRVLASLNDGNVFVGPAATVKLNLARVLNAAGANNDEKIANTETLISNLGRNTLGMVKSSGLGTGQGFTDKDLQFLERVAGGSIDYNAQTLRNLAELSHKAASASAESWGKRVKEIPASALGGTGISTEAIVVPPRVTKAAAATRPAGVPADWVLHTDAAGKKAYVSPDGKSFKEVP